jgi:UDP-N-acetylglucosamine 2-epimerase (non-hydrolysing)
MDPIAIVLGTRPEIIKMSPIIAECEEQSIKYYIIHTNQHYSEHLDAIFFEQLNLPAPQYSLAVGSSTHGEQTANMLQKIEKIFLETQTSFVLVHGDTNTTLAGALSAAKLNIPVGHVEAGLRSHDRKMPEEINRIITDHLSDLCFVPTKNQKEILQNEGIQSSKIIVTGNTIVDAINRNMQFSNKNILEKHNIIAKNYFLATIHRAENVEDKDRLEQIFTALAEVGRINGIPVVAPLHPRTVKLIEKYRITLDSQIKNIDAVGYFEFLTLLKNTKLVLTDSGGIQEEACIMGVPCVTIRTNTERPETIEVGSNILGGIRKTTIIKAAGRLLTKPDLKWDNPFGDGRSSIRIIEEIVKFLSNE